MVDRIRSEIVACHSYEDLLNNPDLKTVGILVDRGQLGDQFQLVPSNVDHHVAVLFLGGPDDVGESIVYEVREISGNTVEAVLAITNIFVCAISREKEMADENVFAVHSPEEGRSKLQEAIDTKRFVVVDFTATWCGPCRFTSPVFVELSKKFPEILFLKVNVDKLKDVANEWQVRAMPTFIFIKDGEAIDTLVGANKEELERKVASLATEAAAAVAARV